MRHVSSWNKVHCNKRGADIPTNHYFPLIQQRVLTVSYTRYVARFKQDAENRGLKDEDSKDVTSYQSHFKDISVAFDKEMEFFSQNNSADKMILSREIYKLNLL